MARNSKSSQHKSEGERTAGTSKPALHVVNNP
jgi:hypothetical protein